MNITGDEHPYNSQPQDYVVDISGTVRMIVAGDHKPSKRVVLALQQVNKNVHTKGFRRAVSEAIFDDAVEQEFSDEPYRERLIRRLNK